MSQDSTQVRVAPNGHIWVAALGTAIPATPTTTPDTGWKELGYADESGVEITPSLTTAEIKAWQSAAPLRIIPTEIKLELKFNLQQFNADTTSLFFGGATWAAVSGHTGVSKLLFSSTPNVDERMVMIDWQDVSINCRLVVERGLVTNRDKLDIVRSKNQVFGVTFSALDAAGNFAQLFSDDPTLVAA